MFDYLEELKKFNVNYIELTEKDFKIKTKNKSTCIVHDKIKDLILTQETGVEKIYLIAHTNFNKFIQQIIYSNKEHTIIYQPQTELLSVFDKDFSFLLNMHSDFRDPSIQFMGGPNWRDDFTSMFRLKIQTYNSNNAYFTIKPHSKRTNEFHCESDSVINKLCLFVFKEDCVKFNFHLSPIKNMIFDLEGKIQSINLLDRISTQTYTDVEGYKQILKKTQNDIDFHTLCTDNSFTMMQEDTFNKNIEFISNIIKTYKNLNINKLYQSIETVAKNFNKLEIMPAITKNPQVSKGKSMLVQSLKGTSYEHYLNISQEDKLKQKILMFLAVMKIKNNSIESFLTPKIIKEIQFINDTAKYIENAEKETIKSKSKLNINKKTK